MTYANFDAAINALNTIPTTQEGIMNFVRQLSVQADGAVTYLYAGKVNDTDAWRVINAIDSADTSQIRHIGKTIASDVLNSDQFLEKVAKAFGLAPDAIKGARLNIPASANATFPGPLPSV
jgi:hypothetical protein